MSTDDTDLRLYTAGDESTESDRLFAVAVRDAYSYATDKLTALMGYAAAKEAVSEAVAQELDEFRETGQVRSIDRMRAYVLTRARSRAADRCKSDDARRIREGMMAYSVHSQPENPEEAMLRREMEHVVDRAADLMPTKRQYVFLNVVKLGRTHEELARELGITPGAVRSLRNEALQDIQRALETYTERKLTLFSISRGKRKKGGK